MLVKDTSASIILILNAVKFLIFHFCLEQILLIYNLLKITIYTLCTQLFFQQLAYL